MTLAPGTLDPEFVCSSIPEKAESHSRHQRILIVEDNADMAEGLRLTLEGADLADVDVTSNGTAALKLLEERSYSLVITDLRMPKVNGMDLLREIQDRKLSVTVMVMTGYGSIDGAVEAMQSGAYDFLTKPVDPERLILLVRRALGERSLRDELTDLRDKLSRRNSFEGIVSKNPRMLQIFDRINFVSETSTTVLIEGETGTGKEMIARAIHQASEHRRDRPLVIVNCAALPENLLESELFGHEKGSFTSAIGQRKKLLRILQERQFERVGGSETIRVDVRIVGATNRNLQTLVKEGKFREDLFYRLNVFKIDLPPLRDRIDDIPLLAIHFAAKYARPGQPPCVLSPEAMERILSFSWPGNIRQLENAIEGAAVTARDGVIRAENLPLEVLQPLARKRSFPIDLSRTLPDQLAELTADFEKRYLRRALKKSRGHVARCAKISGMSRRSVTSKIAQYKIDTADFKL